MPFVDRTRVHVGYKDESNVVYDVTEEAGILAQAKLGEVALAGGEPKLPKSVKKRYTTVRDAADKVSRKITIFSPGAPIQTKGTTINLNRIVAGAYTTTVFTASGDFQGERQPRGNALP